MINSPQYILFRGSYVSMGCVGGVKILAGPLAYHSAKNLEMSEMPD